MDKEESFKKLQSIGQQHLFKNFDALNSDQQKKLIIQVKAINIPTFRMQQQLLLQHEKHTARYLDPFDKISYAGNEKLKEKGKKLIAEGKVGCLIVAGGMGTRLRFNGPKGMFPISPVKNKTLFHLFAEKTLAAGKDLPLAIMTSPLNHTQTVAYFEENHFFGLDKDQIDFFSQGMLPLLDKDGNLFLDATGHMAVGPDGNGTSLQHFVKSGIWDKWHKKGVKYLNYVLIDNPLADPYDAELAGFHDEEMVDIVVKCTSRQDPFENVGILIEKEDKTTVIEYTELPETERVATNSDGSLKHIAANLSLFSFSMDFIQQHFHETLPLHLAHKNNVWKFETFIFDVLPLSWAVKALLYPREECFAPLKNSEGNASPETVKAALQARDKKLYKEITGKEAPDGPFELDLKGDKR